MASGIYGISWSEAKKQKIKYQDHKLQVVQKHTDDAAYVVGSFEPDVVVSEIIPAVGGGNFAVATQNQLALVALTCWHTVATIYEIEIHQVAANTVKTKIGGSGKASKVKVRNGVLTLLPTLYPRKQEWTKIFDESDGLAVPLAWAGYEPYATSVAETQGE